MLTTPSDNQTLAQRLGDFDSLVEGLDYAARGETGFNFHDSRGRLESVLAYADLRAHARSLARRLHSLGLERGDRVAVVAETSPAFMELFFACQYGGFIPVPLPLCINFAGVDAYRDRLRGMILAADARLAVADDALIENLRVATDGQSACRVETHSGLREVAESDIELEPLAADDTCYIQYSSGSTAFPRGVVVTQKALVANARSIGADGLSFRPGDRGCSWLPLYHDMGLVGCCLTPVMHQISVDFLATSTFAKRPLVWLDLISRNKATIAFGPTFGFELCSRRASKGLPEGLDLSSWRVAGIGGEMIRPAALNGFAETFEKAGFVASAFVPSYGMAETTLAVTFAPLGTGVENDVVLRRDAYEDGLAVPSNAKGEACEASVREFAVCGRPMAGYAIEIRDDLGRCCPDRTIGRIFIKAPSLMGGYFREPELTAKVMAADGWLNSGDLGYMIDGNLVVTGRSKDLIIVGGRNIWPQDLEWAVESLDGVRSGDSAAFAVGDDEDCERAVIVAECRVAQGDQRAALRRAIRAEVHRVAGIDCEIVLAAPRSLHFTTSGKLSRAAVKSAFMHGDLIDLDDESNNATDASSCSREGASSRLAEAA